MQGIKQAVILAGGLGIRLRPLTYKVPKPMVLIYDKPFLEYIIEQLKANGIQEIVLLLGYMPEKFIDYFGDGSKFGVKIKYSIGMVNDESGTRLRNANILLQDNFLLLYSDNYWPLSLKKMYKFYKSKKVLGMVTIYNNKDGFAEYGFENNIGVSAEGMVIIYDKSRKDPRLKGVDIGFFILNKKVIDLMPEDNFSFEQIILPKLIQKNELCGYTTDSRYYTITNIEKLDQTKKQFNQQNLSTKRKKPYTKVVFLDRDGVINKNAAPHHYITSWDDFTFLTGAIEGIKLLNQNGYQIIIVSNQRGISRGLFTEQTLNDMHEKMRAELAKENATIDDIYFCPHANEVNCDCRKPKPGMLLQAADEHSFDITKAIFIGDSDDDQTAGAAAGCKMIRMQQDGNLSEVVRKALLL